MFFKKNFWSKKLLLLKFLIKGFLCLDAFENFNFLLRDSFKSVRSNYGKRFVSLTFVVKIDNNSTKIIRSHTKKHPNNSIDIKSFGLTHFNVSSLTFFCY